MKHNFIALISFLFLFNATSNAYAGAISLDLPDITKKGDSLDVHGSCGGVKVKVIGVREETFIILCCVFPLVSPSEQNLGLLLVPFVQVAYVVMQWIMLYLIQS